jgi:aarF domain-containing kinase
MLEDLFWMYGIWSLEMLGPAFIKMAQWASTRPDLYPRSLTERLERLQDQVHTSYSIQTVERTLTSSFGEGWRDELELLDEPIGSGCIAQVYRGNLKKDGTPVAVKVLHPNIERKVRLDMQLLGYLAATLDSFPRLEMLSLGDTCRQFMDVMRLQLDLSIEAENLRVFRKLFKNDTWAQFPRPVDSLVSRHVLVEEFMEGRPIKEFAKLSDADAKSHALKLKLSDIGSRSVIKMVFFDNFIHGDLHPGNMLVHFDKRGEPYVVYLDCGIVYSQPTEADHDALVGVCVAFMQQDGYKVRM